MSLVIVRQVDARYAQLLQTNVGATCHEFTLKVIDALREEGHQAFLVCKSPGEGQYTPPGFQQRMVTGLDGKSYLCSGVSHDAIWSDGAIYDTIASANDGPDPILQGDTWYRLTGQPVWNAIPREHWRPNNPPLKDDIPSPAPLPQPPTVKPYPGDEIWDAVGVVMWADYEEAGQNPNPLMGRWFGRTIWDATEGDESGTILTVPASIAKHRREWRGALGLPPETGRQGGQDD